ncbi:MAG: MBOAT family protein [Alistipes sp.]
MILPQISDLTEKIQALLTYDTSSPMIFSSGLFLFLFAGFIFVYSFLRRATSARIIYVILFSLYFYYKSSGIYFLLLVFAAVSDYFIAKGIAKAGSKAGKRWFVLLSILVNLGMLGYFKYTNFLIDIANQLFGQGFMQFQNIFLPVGISFFVFQSMSYTIDIYRGELKPLDKWTDYLFYLSFFPQLVAGPIVRAKDFIPQIRRNPVTVTREMFGMGVFLILTGLFKKAIISDYISLNFVDRIFDEPLLYSGFECLAGIYGYALQIYCDFSGYSDMAIGIALLLGFHFPKNFDAPYKSASITEFWRRWHISLSTWLKDYLYISLGGNRKGYLRTYGNLLITMILGGLWHGAALRFVLWGALHGVALALHKVWLSVVPNSKMMGADMPWWNRAVGVFVTFNIVCFGWLMFRAESMQTVWLMLHQIVYNFNIAVIPQVLTGYMGVFLLMGAGYVLHLLPASTDRRAQQFIINSPLIFQVVMTAGMIWCVMLIKSSEIQPFIYFQF